MALVGWTASVAVHLSAISENGLWIPFPLTVTVWIVCFVVWIRTVFYLKDDEEYTKFQRSGILKRSNPITLVKISFKNAPTYLKVIAIAGYLYLPLNIFLLSGYPPVHDASNDIRILSGFWIAFYGLSLGVLYPFKREVVL